MKRHGKRTKKSKGHLFPKLVDETYRALCARHHHEQHALGIRSFQRFYDINLTLHAKMCYLEYERDYLTPFRGL